MGKKANLAINLIHASDIHFGSGELHGRINPNTGLNVRFEDFVLALTKVVDYAISTNCDVFLFSGDAYKNAYPEPIYQKMFARQLRRLSEAEIRTILLVGNHDQILKSTASHSMSVFQSLGVPHLITIDQPAMIKIETKRGPLQLIGIPYITRNFLMTNPEFASLSPAQVDKELVNRVRELITGMLDDLDPDIPTVASAHIMMDQARAGIEQELMVGYSLSFPLDMFIDARIDYVALGHVHKHQVLHPEKPAIVYAGSIERVDFSEEAEDKGFVHVELQRHKCRFTFHSITPRPFVTVDIDVSAQDNPTHSICAAIENRITTGCVLRIRYRVRQDQLVAIDEQLIREAAAQASMVHLKAEVVVPRRECRMPQITEESANTPITALETYLEQIAPDRKDRLLEKARELYTRVQQDH